MKKRALSLWTMIPILVVVLSALAPLAAARADGGPVVGSALWAQLSEGQQVAVVRLRDMDRADVDLFISMLDSSGESHQVVFFVPLGVEASDFHVNEQDMRDFDDVYTRQLDLALYHNAGRRQGAVRSLFGATLLTNGVWLLPLWLPVFLTSCAAPPPELVLETESSQVEIYGLDDNTDLDGLISTTGLDTSVKETLSRLRGQRIAVVTLQTQAQGEGGGAGGEGETGETGIHLRWTTSLVPGDAGNTYAYPLGTGSAWSQPIELTRVYVVAPADIALDVEYPRLGKNMSGYNPRGAQRITDYYDDLRPAYAVDEAYYESSWHVWRAVYTQSNAAEDIIVTARPRSAVEKMFAAWQSAGTAGWAALFGFIAALALWILGWRFLVPRFLGSRYRGNIGELWRFALVYTGVNVLLMIPGVFIYLFWSFSGNNLAFLFLWILFGGVSAIIFFASQFKRLVDKESQALKALALVTVSSNGAYLVLALAFSALTGVL